MTVAFGVENVPFKQAYLQKAWEKLGGTAAQACLFNDMCHLVSEKRKCVVHPPDRGCALPDKLSFYCSGFSCTSLSPLNSSSAANASAFAEQKARFADCRFCIPREIHDSATLHSETFCYSM